MYPGAASASARDGLLADLRRSRPETSVGRHEIGGKLIVVGSIGHRARLVKPRRPGSFRDHRTGVASAERDDLVEALAQAVDEDVGVGNRRGVDDDADAARVAVRDQRDVSAEPDGGANA